MVDAAILSQWIVNVGRRDAKSRLAHLLCEMATRIHPRPAADPFVFPFQVTQAQLADATGLTTVHINRVIRILREDRVADGREDEMMILNWNRLSRLGAFNADCLQNDNATEEKLRILPAA